LLSAFRRDFLLVPILRVVDTVGVVTLPASALRLPTTADRPAVRALSA